MRLGRCVLNSGWDALNGVRVWQPIFNWSLAAKSTNLFLYSFLKVLVVLFIEFHALFESGSNFSGCFEKLLVENNREHFNSILKSEYLLSTLNDLAVEIVDWNIWLNYFLDFVIFYLEILYLLIDLTLTNS